MDYATRTERKMIESMEKGAFMAKMSKLTNKHENKETGNNHHNFGYRLIGKCKDNLKFFKKNDETDCNK